MKPGNTINRLIDAVNAVIEAANRATAVAVEVDNLGGIGAVEDYVDENEEALGFTFADVQGAIATLGNVRLLATNQAANFPAGSATNLAKLRT
jgi:hypothetical protein